MARRLFKRDRKGRFAKTSGGGSSSSKKAVPARKKKAKSRSVARKKKANAFELKHYGASKTTATPLQRKNRKRRTVGNAVVFGSTAVLTTAALAGFYAEAKYPHQTERFNAGVDSFIANKFGRSFTQEFGKGIGSTRMAGTKVPKATKIRKSRKTGAVKRNRTNKAYRVTTAQKPRRGYR